ncbi:hypothetical protein GVAV_002389 [Gurleya vavrai]
MTNFTYKSRKQPESRSHLGPLESKKEALQRLNEIKKTNEKLSNLKTEVETQTGDEFFFAMQRKNEKLDTFEKDLLYLEWEMRRVKQKMNKKSEGVHLRFDKNETLECKKEEDKWFKYYEELKNIYLELRKSH